MRHVNRISISRRSVIDTLGRVRAVTLGLEWRELDTAIDLTDPEHLHQLVVVGGNLACALDQENET